MPLIFCKINLFNIYQQVIFINEKEEQFPLGSVMLTNLAETLVNCCYAHGVYNIQLMGGKFCETIVDKINEYNMKEYSNKQEILVEVI